MASPAQLPPPMLEALAGQILSQSGRSDAARA